MSEYIHNIVNGVQSFLTGMKLTLNHLIHKKEKVATLQYPHEKWPIPDRKIGFEHSEYNLIRSRLHVDIDDCISCMQCERACPVDCIKIDAIKPPKDSEFDCGMTSNDTQKKMIVSRFTIDMSECMYCNLCVYPCPEECIYMVGGPNAQKHDIDYEFSQYERDGMIFEFADASDDEIRAVGGDKWIEQRDIKNTRMIDGSNLEGIIPETEQLIVQEVQPSEDKKSEDPQSTVAKPGGLEITSFNDIPDKMCRGIAKKAYTASKRSGLDKTAILASVAQALSDAGKMNDSIQKILDTLSSSLIAKETDNEPAESIDKPVDIEKQIPAKEIAKEIDIKDLNDIDDKMARGIAKKAFVAAKRSGEDKVSAISAALTNAGKINEKIESLLQTYVVSQNIHDDSIEKPIEKKEESSNEPKNEGLFQITDLNDIDDKMARGIAKKVFTAGKRSEKSRSEVIKDIGSSLKEAGKLNDDIEKVLKKLEN